MKIILHPENMQWNYVRPLTTAIHATFTTFGHLVAGTEGAYDERYDQSTIKYKK